MKYFFLVLAVVLLLGLYFGKSIQTHIKALLLIAEEFPQVALKPISFLTAVPSRKTVTFTSDGRVNADLFVPKGKGSKPALIIAMGVKTADKDRPVILHFAETMARLGYVVLWPRLKVLDEGKSLPEDPETFISAFEYLKDQDFVDTKRISFIGFSVGSSIAFVAASDQSINEKVHGLVFFGGYYDIFDYFESLALRRMLIDDQSISWQPDESAINHVREILETKKAQNLLKIFEAKGEEDVEVVLQSATEKELEEFKRISPKEKLDDFKARIFILHEKSDSFVPYTESIKLSHALPKDMVKSFLIANLFEHVQPKKGFSLEVLGEFLKLYGFLNQALSYL